LKDKDYIKELFSEKLAKHESPVRSDLWNGIQSQLGSTTSTTMAVKGISSSIKWMLGIASTVAVVGTTIWLSSSKDTQVSDSLNPVSSKENSLTNETTEAKSHTKLSEEKKKPLISSTLTPTLIVPQNVESSNQLDTWMQHERHIGQDLSSSSTNGIFPIDTDEREVSTTYSNPTTNLIVKESEVVDKIIAQEEKTNEVTGKVDEYFNVFTPNGDGENDYFYLKTKYLSDFSIRVFNDKNELVYQSNDPDFKWFGLDANGNNVPAGNYGYVVFATDTNGKLIKVFKTLTIR
jgi:gliding motility-associated-like protein